MNTSACKFCGQKIVWGQTEDGKNIPLDPRAAVYFVSSAGPNKVIAARATDAMVNHWATCREAQDAKAKKQQETTNGNE